MAIRDENLHVVKKDENLHMVKKDLNLIFSVSVEKIHGLAPGGSWSLIHTEDKTRRILLRRCVPDKCGNNVNKKSGRGCCMNVGIEMGNIYGTIVLMNNNPKNNVTKVCDTNSSWWEVNLVRWESLLEDQYGFIRGGKIHIKLFPRDQDIQ